MSHNCKESVRLYRHNNKEKEKKNHSRSKYIQLQGKENGSVTCRREEENTGVVAVW